MIFNAAKLEPGWFAQRAFDVCVVGTGPAGLSLARRLAGHGLSVALMEGGSTDLSFESQELYDGLNVGADYWPLNASRRRFLGGSSNCWGGWCRALDAHDFDAVAHHRWSGWPIAKTDLDPYATEAGTILDVGDEGDMTASSFGDDSGVFRQIDFRFSQDRLLAPRLTSEIKASEKIDLFLEANLVDLELDEDLQTVSHAIFRHYDRPETFRVKAKAYALCLGGLENPRFLLNTTRQLPNGIGNQHDLVGRFFNEHPHQTVGHVLLREPMRAREFYAPEPQFMAEREVLSFALYFAPVRQLSFTHELIRSAACNVAFVERLAEVVRGTDTRCYVGGLEDFLKQWRNPDIMLTGTLSIASEQALDPESRVRLGSATDRFGHRRIELDWRYGELDLRTILTATTAFGELLAERNVGRLKIADWLLDGSGRMPGTDMAQVGGPHHMCTTRMSDDPRRGVVDRDCRVHGMNNLYIGGSSVFATGGFANPTFTIVQLALRLGDHLAVAV
jgi:hypothetical protein